MRKDGKHQVVFELNAGNADFPYIAGDYHIAILPAKDGKIAANDGIGTGPYMVKFTFVNSGMFFSIHSALS